MECCSEGAHLPLSARRLAALLRVCTGQLLLRLLLLLLHCHRGLLVCMHSVCLLRLALLLPLHLQEALLEALQLRRRHAVGLQILRQQVTPLFAASFAPCLFYSMTSGPAPHALGASCVPFTKRETA